MIHGLRLYEYPKGYRCWPLDHLTIAFSSAKASLQILTLSVCVCVCRPFLPSSLQHLSNHEMIYVLISPIAQVTGDTGNKTNIKDTFLNAVIDSAIGIECSDFRLLSFQLAASFCSLLIRFFVGCFGVF